MRVNRIVVDTFVHFKMHFVEGSMNTGTQSRGLMILLKSNNLLIKKYFQEICNDINSVDTVTFMVNSAFIFFFKMYMVNLFNGCFGRLSCRSRFYLCNCFRLKKQKVHMSCIVDKFYQLRHNDTIVYFDKCNLYEHIRKSSIYSSLLFQSAYFVNSLHKLC